MKKTILYGNGLNYHSKSKNKSITWKALLKEIMMDQVFEIDFLPNTITYERIRFNWNKKNGDNNNLKERIAELLKEQPSNPYYKDILDLKCENYITTNYDYALNKTFLEIKKENLEIEKSNEELYSIRRNTILKDPEENTSIKVWNIHGELKSPKSIMLGLNHYCGSVGKINNYIKGSYDFSYKGKHKDILKIEDKLESNNFDNISWIELFFNSNVHIIGFGLDFSETDLWWVLTKRARLIESGLIKNKIYFYTKPILELEKGKKEKEENKRKTLKNFGVDIIETPNKGDYNSYWNSVFNKIKTSS